MVCDNRLELGTLIAFVTLAGYFTGPFQTLSLVVPQINVLKETMIRLKELMNYKSNRKNGTQRINSFESMEMQQVTFSYYGSTKPDVENVSMMLKEGQDSICRKFREWKDYNYKIIIERLFSLSRTNFSKWRRYKTNMQRGYRVGYLP